MPKGSRFVECNRCKGLGLAYYLSDVDPETGFVTNERVCQTCWEKDTKKNA